MDLANIFETFSKDPHRDAERIGDAIDEGVTDPDELIALLRKKDTPV